MPFSNQFEAQKIQIWTKSESLKIQDGARSDDIVRLSLSWKLIRHHVVPLNWKNK